MNASVDQMRQLAVTLRSEPMQKQIAASLPPDITADRFTATAITALNQNPKLADADRQSLYNAIVRAAQDGLLPDGREGAIVAFGGKAQFMPMVAGIIKRLGEAGVTLDAQVVHENDEFEYRFGDDAGITHKPPKLGKPRGEIIGCYAIAKLANGEVLREVMDSAQVEAVRQQSRAKDSLMWTTFRSEAYRKTVARRIAKKVPIVSEKLADMLKRDDEQYTFDAEPETPAPVEQQKPATNRPKALQGVVDQVSPQQRPAHIESETAAPQLATADPNDDPDDVF